MAASDIRHPRGTGVAALKEGPFMADNAFPAGTIDLQSMNRRLRHRLRNLCAGLKLTTESIQLAAGEDRGLAQKCVLMLAEIRSLQRLTERMDWLFDALPAPVARDWAALAEAAAAEFRARFPRCRLSLDGPSGQCGIDEGNWMEALLRELLANAGEAAGGAGEVRLLWSLEDGLCFSVVNAGSAWPDAVSLDPPVPFAGTRGQHMGIGLSIVHRICLASGMRMDVSMPAPEVVAVRIRRAREEP
jgi:signal transduction histidine kinase